MTKEQMLKVFADHGLSGINEETAVAVATAICNTYEQELSEYTGRLFNVISACNRDGVKIDAVLTQLEKEIK